MEWQCEAEERILATQLNKSRNLSTFVCSDSSSIKINSWENRETKFWELNKDLRSNSGYKVHVGSFKIGSEGKGTENVQWQPSCAQNMQTE